MAREPVAIDFINLGGMAKGGVGGLRGSSLIGHDEGGGRDRLVKPLSNLPDHHENVQSLSKILLEPEGTRTRSSSCFNQPGLYQLSWVNAHLAAGVCHADIPNEENSGVITKTLVKKDIFNDSHSVNYVSRWDCTASKTFPSQYEIDIPQQPPWKTESKYGSCQQALRNIPVRASPSRYEAQTTSPHIPNLSGNHPISILHQYSSSDHNAELGSQEHLCSEINSSNGEKKGSLQACENPPHPQDLQHSTHGANMAAADTVKTLTATGRLACAAQLTIFYADMVNVYEDVPYDKAQSIMLLASKESHSNHLNPLRSYGAPAHPGVSYFGAMSQPTLRASSPAPSNCAGRQPPRDVPMAIRPTPSRTIELPQARKASLARFLERRRDRVRSGPYAQRNEELGRARHASPSPSLSTAIPPIRPLFPSAAKKQSSETSNVSEANTLPSIQPSQSTSEDIHQMPRKESETNKEITQSSSGSPSPTTEPLECEAVVR